MKALVTGAGGFCGTHLCRYLEEEGVQVFSVGHRESGRSLQRIIPDMRDVDLWASVLHEIQPDYIFHLAGIVHSSDPCLFYQVNTQIAVALMEALDSSSIRNCPLLIAGTSAEYGQIVNENLPITESLTPQPYNHYGISKLAQTLEGLAAGRKGMPVVVARPFNVIGPGMPDYLVVQNFVAQLKSISDGLSLPCIEVGNIETSRDFISVKDVVRIYWKLIRTSDAYGEVVNVCSGGPVSVKEVLFSLIEMSAITNISVKKDTLRLKSVDIPCHYGSTDKLRRIIGPISFSGLDFILKDILREAGL